MTETRKQIKCNKNHALKRLRQEVIRKNFKIRLLKELDKSLRIFAEGKKNYKQK